MGIVVKKQKVKLLGATIAKSIIMLFFYLVFEKFVQIAGHQLDVLALIGNLLFDLDVYLHGGFMNTRAHGNVLFGKLIRSIT